MAKRDLNAPKSAASSTPFTATNSPSRKTPPSKRKSRSTPSWRAKSSKTSSPPTTPKQPPPPANKQTGSFFTPRQIVNYMVDEALMACLKTKLDHTLPSTENVDVRLRHLFAYNDELHKFVPQEV